MRNIEAPFFTIMYYNNGTTGYIVDKTVKNRHGQAHKVFVAQAITLRTPKRELTKIGCDGVKWIYLAWDRDYWRSPTTR
jgi:hypothetical protein